MSVLINPNPKIILPENRFFEEWHYLELGRYKRGGPKSLKRLKRLPDDHAAGESCVAFVVYIACKSSNNAFTHARSLEPAFERWDQRTVSDGLAADAEADQNVQLRGSRI
jgi:hypothetical protein